MTSYSNGDPWGNLVGNVLALTVEVIRTAVTSIVIPVVAITAMGLMRVNELVLDGLARRASAAGLNVDFSSLPLRVAITAVLFGLIIGPLVYVLFLLVTDIVPLLYVVAAGLFVGLLLSLLPLVLGDGQDDDVLSNLRFWD